MTQRSSSFKGIVEILSAPGVSPPDSRPTVLDPAGIYKKTGFVGNQFYLQMVRGRHEITLASEPVAGTVHVIPAKAGIQVFWAPAFAGVTVLFRGRH